jgi:aminodeoxyfutalosine deaminase
MILRARIVVTINGAPIENGAVAIEGKRIAEVGTFDEVKAHRTGKVIDLGEQVLLPGLINAHCHLDYTCLRGKIAPPRSFTDWIRAINAEKAKLSPDDYGASIVDGFAEAKRFGTTTIANLTAFPELMARIEPPIRTWWFAELIDVRTPECADAMVARAVEFLKSTPHWGLAPHAVFTASAHLYRECERNADLLTTHLAESREETSMFRDCEGPLYELLSEIGREMNDCGAYTPIEAFFRTRDSSRLHFTTERQATSPGMTKSWMLVHLNELSGNDLDLLRQARAQFSVVHCPCSHRYFGREPFPLEKIRGCGVNLCLGTDSLASNGDLSLFGEMSALQEAQPTLSSEEILKMVTINPARALQMGDELGQLQPGFIADLIAIPAKLRSKDVFDEIISCHESVSWMMIEGKVVTA